MVHPACLRTGVLCFSAHGGGRLHPHRRQPAKCASPRQQHRCFGVSPLLDRRKSVFIYEIDETTIGLKIDADNNGTYETDLTQSLRKVGDINGDGKLNVRDITALQRCLAEINTLGDDDRAAADINDDGKIDILDVTCLQRYLAEFVTILGR
ncbi:MAG: dockerin type I repeat-containing protein [Ruminococcus sp.]|nr:dockerin type I repeat-containing protein [Ruminococcus sp.]